MNTYYTFTIITPSDGRRVVADEAEWAAVERLPAGSVVDVRGDVFEDWQGAMNDTDDTPMEFTATRSNGTTVARTVTMQDIRDRLFVIIDRRPDLTFIVTTRHVGNMAGMMPMAKHEGGHPYCSDCGDETDLLGECGSSIRPNLWLGVVVRTQAEADAMVPALMSLPAANRVVDVIPGEPICFVYPPSLYPNGPDRCCDGRECGCLGLPVQPPEYFWPPEKSIGLVRVYGEGDPIHPDWVRSIISQCESAGVPVQFLGWGDWLPAYSGWLNTLLKVDPYPTNAIVSLPKTQLGGMEYLRIGRERSGNLIDGKVVMQWPK